MTSAQVKASTVRLLEKKKAGSRQLRSGRQTRAGARASGGPAISGARRVAVAFSHRPSSVPKTSKKTTERVLRVTFSLF